MMSLKELHDFLLHHLTEEVMPFWMKHAVDLEHGGLYSYLDNDGTILSRNKNMISNTRALWTFSALVNRIEDREEWRQAAENQYAFLKAHGRDEDKYWVYTVNQHGQTVVGENSIVVDAFALAGLVEYHRMCGNEHALTMARDTYDTVQERLARPGTYKTAPYPTPEGMRPQREAMQFSLTFAELGQAAKDTEVLGAGVQLGHDVLDHFWRPEKRALLEYLSLDNQPMDTPAGRCMVPGHAFESLAYQIHVFSHLVPGEKARAKIAAQALQVCFERGWDSEFGGFLLGIDIEGKEPVYWKHNTMKRWWPITEAISAALLAYEQLGEDWCLEWYWKIHAWAFEHYPCKEHGDWYQNLTREGVPIPAPRPDEQTLRIEASDKREQWVNLQIKDPFHLPRALIVCIETLKRLQAQSEGTHG